VRTKRIESPVLSREAVVARALDLADAASLEAVTVRRIAQEFGVTPMALYWHFKNKEELLDAMGDALFDDVSADVPSGPWHHQLRDILDRLVGALRRHPGSATLAYRRIMACPSGQAVTEAALRVLADAGFSTRESANLAQQALMTVVTLVANEPGTQPGLGGAELEEHLAQKRAGISALPADRFPHVLAAIDDLLDCADADEFYRFSLDLFIAGAQAMRRKATRVG